MIERIGVELGRLFHRRETLVERARGFRHESGETVAGFFFHRQAPRIAAPRGGFGIGTDLLEPAYQLLHAAGDGRYLLRRLIGGLGNLVGQARQALMQRLDRALQALLRDVALQPVQPVGDIHHMTDQLVEGPGLFARGDVDLGRRFVHRAVGFGLAALGGIQAPGHGAQMFINAAPGVR